MKRFEHLTIALGIANLFVLLVSGGLGYYFVQRPIAILEQQKLEVETRKGATDEAKLSIDVSNFLKDLRPLVRFDCNALAVDQLRVRVSCNANNIGQHKVFIQAPSVSLKFKANRQVVRAEAYKGTLEVKFTQANSIPPGLNGGFEYEVVFTKQPDFNLFDLETEFSTHTDVGVVQLVAKLLQDRLDSALLSSISQQVYKVTCSVDASSLRPASP